PIVLLAEIDAKPVDDDKLFFIHGEVNEENLERANISAAATVIILGNDDLEPGARDARVVLSTLTAEGMSRDAYTVVELVHEANRRHCQRAHADEIIVGNEFSSRLIASAAVDHGISKVFSELLSVTYGNDLKQVPVPASLVGQSFFDVMTELKRTDGSIVLAVQRGREVITNPPNDYPVESSDHLIVVAS
ncbi:MAG: cag pathogenicity island protein Cag26, partial [Acidobacteriota bacterium]